MNHAAVAALLIAAAFVAAPLPSAAQNEAFPYFKCGVPTPYSFPGVSRSYGNGTFCGTLVVTPPTNASDPCAKADLRKIEVSINPACDVKNTIVKATINGVPTTVSPSFFVPAGAPEGSVVLRMTQLGLGLGSDGDNICITLSAKTPGANACTNLESLCQAPPGAPPGTCVAALVDTTLRCCKVNEVSPSEVTPVRPPPRLTCFYMHPRPTPAAGTPFKGEIKGCKWAAENLLKGSVLSQIAAVGAVMDERVTPFTNCSDENAVRSVTNFCWAFNSSAEGAKLQDWAVKLVTRLRLEAIGYETKYKCSPWLIGHQMDVIFGGYGIFPDIPPGDINADANKDAPPEISDIVCTPDLSTLTYPKCTCNTTVRNTQFGVENWVYTYPGRKPTTTLYCFTVQILNATDPTSPCGRTDKLYKAEIWGDDKQRQKLKGIAIQPVGAKNFTYRSPSWGGPGDQTIKVSQLNWTPQQAKGSKICLELDSTTDLDSFCLFGLKTCWINFFDESLACCPLYPSTAIDKLFEGVV
ncbi:hypothetical protein Vafri_21084 [Volvox africanus]|uniref:Pherophorin domain-containing protein n=1 Tax=Volvox africanus TaxID=51714 RepID=A0A8J4FEM9_9CHLO|nr:hypothetical protein Vafri_21084 [Volvox africanus]